MAEEHMEEHKADAEAGEKLDKILSHLDSLSKRMDAMETKDDAEEEYDDAEEACDDDDDDAKADDEEVEAKSDDDDDDAEMEEFEEEPKRVAADKKRKDAEEEEMKAADAADIRKRIADVERMLPKQLSDAEYAKFSDAQAKADSVYQAFGDSAPRPLNGEGLMAYRRRLARGLQKHSAKLKEVNLGKIVDSVAFGYMEEQIYSDAMAAAMSPVDLPRGALREMKRPDTTGRIISTFVGEPRAWMGSHAAPRRRLVGVTKN